MKKLWCWRCQQERPMLEPDEMALVNEAHAGGMQIVEREAQRRGRVLIPMQPESRVAQRLRPMLEMYKLLTGFEETSPNAVWHHQVAQYGPPCPQCHKPLRTPVARFCAACSFGQENVTAESAPLAERRPELFT